MTNNSRRVCRHRLFGSCKTTDVLVANTDLIRLSALFWSIGPATAASRPTVFSRSKGHCTASLFNAIAAVFSAKLDAYVARLVGANVAMTSHAVLPDSDASQRPAARGQPTINPLWKGEFPRDPSFLCAMFLVPVSGGISACGLKRLGIDSVRFGAAAAVGDLRPLICRRSVLELRHFLRSLLSRGRGQQVGPDQANGFNAGVLRFPASNLPNGCEWRSGELAKLLKLGP